MTIKQIRELSSKLLATPDVRPTTIYFLEAIDKRPSPDSVARIGGKPIGITPDTWPLFDGKPMEHLITLDLAELPELKTGALADARAVALFIGDRMENEAYEPGTKETSIIVLSQDDIDKGEPPTSLRESGEPASRYEVTPVRVPASVFDDPHEEEEESPLHELRSAIYSSSCYAGGKPLWLQFAEHEGHFLFQFDESFIDVNLGDAGVMYVFTDTAFWQCH
jgi:hypothetical protein